MQSLILTLHVIVCIFLVILVLLQAGKEGMGVIFGGGNASVFGASGAGNLLTKLTAFMAVLFIVTSLSYNIMTSTKRDDESTILNIQLEDMSKSTQDAPKTILPNTMGTTKPIAEPVAEPKADPKATSQTAPAKEPQATPTAEPKTSTQ